MPLNNGIQYFFKQKRAINWDGCKERKYYILINVCIRFRAKEKGKYILIFVNACPRFV